MGRCSELVTLLVPCILIADACATTDSGANTATADDRNVTQTVHRRRHRQRRAVDEHGEPIETAGRPDSAPGADPTGTPASDPTGAASGSVPVSPPGENTFGSPLVRQPGVLEVNPHWIVEGGRGRIVCEGNEARPTPPPTPQSPREPSNAAVVRALFPVERDVLACNPPSNREGRLPVHVTFGAAGYPIEITFPGLHVMRTPANCLGQALCDVHVPTFRNPEADVDYEYVVLVPGAE